MRQTPIHYIQMLDYSFGVLCSVCKAKVLDPSKKKNQVYLSGECPSCGAYSGDLNKVANWDISVSDAQLSKRAARRARRAEKKAAKRAAREEREQINTQSLR